MRPDATAERAFTHRQHKSKEALAPVHSYPSLPLLPPDFVLAKITFKLIRLRHSWCRSSELKSCKRVLHAAQSTSLPYRSSVVSERKPWAVSITLPSQARLLPLWRIIFKESTR